MVFVPQLEMMLFIMNEICAGYLREMLMMENGKFTPFDTQAICKKFTGKIYSCYSNSKYEVHILRRSKFTGKFMISSKIYCCVVIIIALRVISQIWIHCGLHAGN